MRAIVRHEYGGPEVLHPAEVPAPEPGPRQFRVRVRAVAANRGDWELLTGQPRYIAVMAGLYTKPRLVVPTPAGAPRRGPKFKVLGYDIAGEVEAVGSEVTRLRVGDRVFGDCGSAGFGGFAEFVCLDESARIARLPAALSFEQGAAIPEGGSIALKAFRDLAPLASGMRVLINGAGGGAGTFAIQMASAAGAEVTGVDSAGKQAYMRSMGAAHTVDYATTDYAATGARYDVVLDLLARRPVRESRRALATDGAYLLAGGAARPTFEAMLLGPLLSRMGNGRIRFLVADDTLEGLEDLGRLCASGALRPVIDATYPLERTAEALQRIGEGSAMGKVIVTV